jgi:hypothetical protein
MDLRSFEIIHPEREVILTVRILETISPASTTAPAGATGKDAKNPQYLVLPGNFPGA